MCVAREQRDFEPEPGSFSDVFQSEALSEILRFKDVLEPKGDSRGHLAHYYVIGCEEKGGAQTSEPSPQKWPVLQQRMGVGSLHWKRVSPPWGNSTDKIRGVEWETNMHSISFTLSE